MTWQEIKEGFPNEWVALADYEQGNAIEVAGTIIAHHTNKKAFHEMIRPLMPKYHHIAVRYTGKLVQNGELIIVPVTLYGRENTYNGMFVLDTGSSAIIIDHEIVFDLGYSARDSVGFSTISSAVGKERGYRLQIEGMESLGKKIQLIEVRCHDLKEQGVEGLVGMSFLKQFRWCVDPIRQVISIPET